MSSLNERHIDLQMLVRVALHNRELAPGVARQIDLIKATLLSATEKRLLAVLDDAIAHGLITVITPINHRSTLQSTPVSRSSHSPANS